MATSDLTLFSIEILGLVGREGAGPHDLLRLAQSARMLAWAGESRYYPEPKRLAELGYLSARKVPGKTRERTVYTLTHQGLEALREHARTPARLTPVKSDALLRLLICDLVGEGSHAKASASCAATSPTSPTGSTTPNAAPATSPRARRHLGPRRAGRMTRACRAAARRGTAGRRRRAVSVLLAVAQRSSGGAV